MSKSRTTTPPRGPAPKPATKPENKSHALREAVESIVIAFVLAFLFRTFEAEAFVIPTGSMAPTLMGRHKDVDCEQCSHRFRLSASEEEGEEVLALRQQLAQGHYRLRQVQAQKHGDARQIQNIQRQIGEIENRIRSFDVVAGQCPVCRYPMPVRPDLPPEVLGPRDSAAVDHATSFNGDRILVNKYIYALADPQRWDVVVFKFPGNAHMNYIKRLVGLPNEVVRVYQGDLFVGGEGAAEDADFEIARKPPEKVLAVRQLVHDTDYDPAALYAAGWPLRWHPVDDSDGTGWQVEATAAGRLVTQRFAVDGPGGTDRWLRYYNTVPPPEVWEQVLRQQPTIGSDVAAQLETKPLASRAELVMDFNAYNTRVTRGMAHETGSLSPPPRRLGTHWVGDLIVEADVEVESPDGELLLGLVEAGRHFTCRMDVASGQATLATEGVADYSPRAVTSLQGPGNYRVAFANVDDQLLLWVDGRLVDFPEGTAYDAQRVFGDRRGLLPTTSPEEPDDLAPARIGSQGAKLAVTRLQLWRDIYYIASRWDSTRQTNWGTDFDVNEWTLADLRSDPSAWDLFLGRRQADFPLGAGQYFVMGDNSAESSDARLWRGAQVPGGGKPGGDYLDGRLLTGKALCVYWPHPWYRIPGTPIPIFPNFRDMRLVR